MISLVNIEKYYRIGGQFVPALKGVDLEIGKNEYVVLLWNGWPAVLYWKHGPKGDQVWIDRASAEASNESN
jgi:hypothetical protein